MKEYIVILKDDVDYDSFWNDIENPSLDLPYIPDRAVDIVNNRDAQTQMCHYMLTNEEAEIVKNDPRVKAVEEPYYNIGLFPQPFAISGSSTGNISFTIPAFTNNSGNNVNWGLIRHNNANNPYANTTVTSSEYQYVLDGTGVDVVIMDTGIEYYHPEFQDANGNSRVVQHNWTGNLNTTPNSINFSDADGHGTACAGITSGKNYGWAKNSAIYTCKIFDSGSISVEDAFDAIKTWHIAKNTPGNPAYTGRPTVVNGSFGYSFSNALLSITSINYRDTGNVAASSPDASKGMTSGPITQFDLASGITYTFSNLSQPLRFEQIDTAANAMIAAGVVFVAAAGNDAHKIAAPTVAPPIDPDEDNDFWNYWNGTWNGISYPQEFRYYNRGSSPGVANAVVVGAIAAGTNLAEQNQKTSYSNAGYGVDVFAVGWNPRTAYANVTNSDTANYWLAPSSGFKQTTFGGTSAAAPQVAGIAALYLQANPTATPTQVKSWLTNNANTTALYSSELSSDYTNYQSQWGGTGGVAFMPYNSANNFAISNSITLSNITLVNT
jgi:subtilisin family serine protease